MIKQDLRDYKTSFIAGTLLAVLLGVISACVYTLVGPVLKILMDGQSDAVVTATELVGPRVGRIVSWQLGQSSWLASDLVKWLPGIMLGLAFLRACFSQAHWYLWERVSEQLAQKTRLRLAQGLLKPRNYRHKDKDALSEDEVASLLSNDLRTAREFVVHYYGGLPRELLQVAFYIATLILLSPEFFMIFLATMVPSAWVLRTLGKRLRRRGQKLMGSYAFLTDWVQQRFLGFETIKHYRSEGQESAGFRVQNSVLWERLVAIARVKAQTSPLMEFFAVVGFVLVVVLALTQVRSAEISGSVLLSFFSILAIVGQSVAKLGKYYNANKEGSVSIDRIRRYLQEVAGDRNPTLLESRAPREYIELVNARVSYEAGPDEAVLKGVTCRFNLGTLNCICGDSGAGKSTLVKSMLGLTPFTEGHLNLPETIRPEDWFYLPQKAGLFPGNIAANIAYPKTHIDLERVRECLQKVKLDLDPQWEPGMSAEGGVKGAEELSGGQIQRIHLARLFYHSGKIVVVDEGTSALDPELETLVIRSLSELAHQGSCVIVVTHRPAILNVSDQIIFMKNGRVSKSGSLEELKSQADFRSLWVLPRTPNDLTI